jgi:hypothetical protein
MGEKLEVINDKEKLLYSYNGGFGALVLMSKLIQHGEVTTVEEMKERIIEEMEYIDEQMGLLESELGHSIGE